jgi:hypothetical protein
MHRYTKDFGYKYVGAGKGDYSRSSWSYTQGSISEFVELLGEKLGDAIDFSVIDEDRRFSFDKFQGKYTWNGTAKRWDQTADSKIIALFPFKEGQTNNCELAFTAYEDKSCDIEGEQVYLPTKAGAYLSKDGTKLASIDVAANYTNYGIPKSASLNIYAKPIKADLALDQTAPSKFTASISFTDETSEDNNLSVVCDAVLSTNINEYSDFDDCEFNSLKFTVKQSNLTIEGTVDIKTLEKVENPSVSDINKCINLMVYYRGQLTGTLKVEEVGDDRYLYIFYKDGTYENTDIYYEKFLDDIEDLFKKYLD